MAFPVIQNTATFGDSSAGTTHTCNLPTGIQAGELLILAVAGSNAVISTPAGWTLLVTGGKVFVFYKTADGSEGTTISISSSVSVKAASCAWRITGADPTPLAGSGIDSGGSTNPDPPSFNTGASADYLWIAVEGTVSGAPTVSTWPTNYSSNQISGLATGGSTASRASVSAATRTNTAQTEDAGAFTISASTPNVAFTLAIKGAAVLLGTATNTQLLSGTANGALLNTSTYAATTRGAALNTAAWTGS